MTLNSIVANFQTFKLVDLLDILIIAFLIYQLLGFVNRTVHGRAGADDLRKVGVPFQHDERAGLGLRKALCRVADGDDGAAPRALEAGG